MSGTGENQGVAQTGKPQRWSFGSAAFDERSMQLFVNSRPVELELKPLEVLRYLLQHAGEAVNKDELIKAVWPGRVMAGHRERSLDLVEQALKVPYGLHANELRMDPAWRQMAGDKRFQEILAANLPKT